MRIHHIKDFSGNWVNDMEEISNICIEFFQNLLTDNSSYDSNYWEIVNLGIQRCIPNVVSEEDNTALYEIPDESEIKQAIFNLNPESAAGPDGYSGQFYQKAWEIIKICWEIG